MRDLVVCCDGTWQDAADRSNVKRLHDLLDDPPQQRCYVKGVGTGNIVDKVRGGLTGAGLSRSLMEGYRFLVEEYLPGDRISLIGFSRGAYTARSLAGMVGGVGIVDRAGLDEDELATAVQQAYARYRGLKAARKARAGLGTGPEMVASTARAGTSELPLAYDPGSSDIPVVFVGVWDTVGALGIPSYLGVPDLFRSRERYEFMNVVLDPRIPHARQAVSLDEMRGPYRPTLWAEPAAGTTQVIKQVWFPGDHLDVGGGRADTRLSEGALKWMVDEAEAAIGLAFRQADRPQIAPDAVGGTLHGLSGGPWGAVMETVFQPRPRATPLVDHDRPSVRVSESAYQRQKSTQHLVPQQRYRPSRTLGPGQTTDVAVEATKAWTATGLYLEKGGYRFTAAGGWSTPFGRCGPRGLARWPVVGDAFGNVVDLVERGLRTVLHNPDAELIGARRQADQPLMMLIGVVANEVTDAEGKVAKRDDIPLTDQVLIIGEGLDAVVERPGYLWAYANDAWGSYGNNDGRVTLTVGNQVDVEERD